MNYPRNIQLIVLLSMSYALANVNSKDYQGMTGKSHKEGIATDPPPKAEAFMFYPSETIFEAAAKGVAQLVSANFAQNDPESDPSKSDAGSTGFMGNVFRLLGFDSTKLRAIAVNAVIFIAQLIGSAVRGQAAEHLKQAFDLPPPGSPLSWIFENSPVQVRQLVTAAQERNLPDEMIASLRDEAVQESDCVQLVVCKASPLVWSMQKSLYTKPDGSWSELTPLERLFHHFPSISELASQSEVCDNRFPTCKERFSGIL